MNLSMNLKRQSIDQLNQVTNDTIDGEKSPIKEAIFELIKQNYSNQQNMFKSHQITTTYFNQPSPLTYPVFTYNADQEEQNKFKNYHVDYQQNNNLEIQKRPNFFLPTMKIDRLGVFGHIAGFNSSSFATDLIGSKLNDYRTPDEEQLMDKSLRGDFTSSESYVNYWYSKCKPFFHTLPDDNLPDSPDFVGQNSLNANFSTTASVIENEISSSPTNQTNQINQVNDLSSSKLINALFNKQSLNTQTRSYSQVVKSKNTLNTIPPNSLESSPYSSRETTPAKTPLIDSYQTKFRLNHNDYDSLVQTPEAALVKENEELCRENALFKSMCENLLGHLYEMTSAINTPSTEYAHSSSNKSPSKLSKSPTRTLNTPSKQVKDKQSGLDKFLPQAKLHRTAANHSQPQLHWSGDLPDKTMDGAEYSTKVFLGGIPWNSTESDFIKEFKDFGKIKLQWPGREVNCTARGEPNKAGYVYCIFENQNQVKKLLESCSLKCGQFGESKWFWPIKSPIRSKRDRHDKHLKEIEVKPWNLNDGYYEKRKFSGKFKTLFIGNLHGRITAKGLFKILDDLFGDVVSVSIDKDKNGYPNGTAKVTVQSESSYYKAINTGFIQINCSNFKFDKKLQIDPYVENAKCSNCKVSDGLAFCRDSSCLNHFCVPCFRRLHETEDKKKHTVIMKRKIN